jgi:hypothetical protein
MRTALTIMNAPLQKKRRPQRFVLKIVIRQNQSLTDDRQNAQYQDVACREGDKKYDVGEGNQAVDPENLINHELVQNHPATFFRSTTGR